MEVTKTNYEVKGDYRIIGEINQVYSVRDNGDEIKLGVPLRNPRYVPGILNGGSYTKTSMKDLPADVKVLANHFWTQEVHDLYEAHLKA